MAASRFTYASAQNSVPILRRIEIEVNGASLDGTVLSVKAEPAFVASREWRLTGAETDEVRRLTDVALAVDAGFFDRLDEAERGTLRFRLTGADGVELARLDHPVELLARDQWGGTDEMGALLSAFVQPNAGAVAGILRAAGDALERQGQPSGMDGYQSGDARRAWSLTAAIWAGIAGLGLRYASPPASFERSGQKVRGPARIVADGLATCLDTTLLICAALEQAGLRPVAILTEGHAFAGVWLVEKGFAAAEVPDAVELRKAIAAREFVPFETTLLTGSPPGAFAAAIAEAKDALSEEREHEFRVAVDITRCRAAGIRPLPRMEPGVEAQAAAEPEAAAAAAAPLAPPDDFVPPEADAGEVAPDTPKGRIERWQRKLLDLSLRNRLLNFRETQQTLPLRCDDVPGLEDRLSDGEEFRLVSLTDENPLGGRDEAQFRRETGEDIHARFVRDAFAGGALCATTTAQDMQGRLTALYRKSRSDLAEGGTNTLFLAIGFLRWKQSEREARDFRAPLLLLPVMLTRASASSPYRLRHQGDEVRFNLTLLEKLGEQGIVAEDLKGELPRDESGLDVPRILKRMRDLVRDVPGFEVLDACAISTFSFAKYLMWKDLVDRTAELRNNRLVGHLIDAPDTPFLPEGSPGLPQARGIDARMPPEEVFTPLPADASQLAAVIGAQEGRDMVVVGPPGTGKSQTIANLIAHCLAHGKTVLFVAEKAVALDVVHRRLSAYGLGDAVLELHSSKADKKGVIAQLGRAWERDARTEGRWRQTCRDLGITREALNGYVEALHRVHGNGLTVYGAIGMAGQGDGAALSWPSMDAHDAETLRGLRSLASDLGAAARQRGEASALALVEAPEGGWSFDWEGRLMAAASTLEEALARQRAALDAFATGCSWIGEDGHRVLPPLAAAMLGEEEGDRAAIGSLDPGDASRAAADLQARQAKLETGAASLSTRYGWREIGLVPVDALDADWRHAQASIWPVSALRRRSVTKRLATYTAGTKAEPGQDLPVLSDLQTELATIAKSPLASLPGWSGRDTDGETIAGAAARVRALSQAIETAGLSPDAPRKPLRDEASAVVETTSAARDARTAFEAVAGRTVEADPNMLRPALRDLAGARRSLQDWVHWCDLRQRAEARGLAPLAEMLATSPNLDARAAFDRAYAGWWLPLAIDAEPELRGFRHWEHADRIARFRELDEAHQTLAADQIRARIAHGLPNGSGVARTSALGQLKGLMAQARPRKSIRAILGDLGATATKLTPCVLMSPLSVAQYLPAGQAQFDIVLFDEASQITTWDAIGAIARGRQSIIVGDPKQMPPSNFFGGNGDEAEEELDDWEQDKPSILDEAVAAGVPEHLLRVHYRSRDEGLIAFSNAKYYGGGLVTFPAPVAEGGAVKLHRIDGTYMRGGGGRDARTNPTEAEAVAAFVKRRLTSWLAIPEGERETLGVITFNIQQQQIILDHLDRMRSEDPRLEWFFEDAREEPVIVKNLENIQGDERDVMLFSVTFGPDTAGKITMNFGAMNKNGGEKRLNVAVTRARREMHVFASMDASSIDIGRTRFQGVRDLRDFLDYAARGPTALAAAHDGSVGGVDSPFEAEVKDALERRGWEVRTQIGVSGYRIDLGVVHPDRAGVYLAGIECDGASYHSSASARDRDRMREHILRGLGWEIERVWSTDWFMRRDEALNRLDEALRGLLVTSQETEREETVRRNSERNEALQKSKIATPVPVSPTTDIDAEGAWSSKLTKSKGEKSPMLARAPQDASSEPRLALDDDLSPLRSSASTSTPASGIRANRVPEPDRFFDADYARTIKGMVHDIVQSKGPIHFDAVAREITRLHGWQRVGQRIRTRIEACSKAPARTEETPGVFLWPTAPEPSIGWRDLPGRDAGEIPIAELAGLLAAEPQLRYADDAALALSRRLGLSRLAAGRREMLESAFAAAVKRLDERSTSDS